MIKKTTVHPNYSDLVSDLLYRTLIDERNSVKRMLIANSQNGHCSILKLQQIPLNPSNYTRFAFHRGKLPPLRTATSSISIEEWKTKSVNLKKKTRNAIETSRWWPRIVEAVINRMERDRKLELYRVSNSRPEVIQCGPCNER